MRRVDQSEAAAHARRAGSGAVMIRPYVVMPGGQRELKAAVYGVPARQHLGSDGADDRQRANDDESGDERPFDHFAAALVGEEGKSSAPCAHSRSPVTRSTTRQRRLRATGYAGRADVRS